MHLPRWLRFILIAIATTVAVAIIVVYGGSEYMLRQRHPLAGKAVPLPTDSASLAVGQHLVTLRGCLGCHGHRGEGEIFFSEPKIATLVAPNLTRAFATYSDTELDGIIRHGIRPNGRTLLGMPSVAFARLRDDDLAHMLAFLHGLPPVDGPGPEISVGPLGRLGLLTGQFSVSTKLVAEVANTPPVADSVAEGSYLARTICTECHGPNLEGDPGFSVPPLAIAATYSWPEFETLMRTGKARGNRELQLMSEVARGRFSQFTPEEMQALYAYLKTL